MRFTPIVVALTACALVVPTTASADGMRVRVCADQLVFTTAPNQGRDGVLAKGQSFRARKVNRTAKYAYGLAYGDINRLGWVRVDGLCNSKVVAKLVVVGRDVFIGRQQLPFFSRASRSSKIGALRSGETFTARKLSASGAFAYGFAHGHLNKLGWVSTSEL